MELKDVHFIAPRSVGREREVMMVHSAHVPHVASSIWCFHGLIRGITTRFEAALRKDDTHLGDDCFLLRCGMTISSEFVFFVNCVVDNLIVFDNNLV